MPPGAVTRHNPYLFIVKHSEGYGLEARSVPALARPLGMSGDAMNTQ
jgi:hypothetical protein